MKNFYSQLLTTLIVMGILILGISTSNATESPADFYKENTLTIYIGFSPGGGTDYASRLFANYWPEVTGGTVVVKNMGGAGGVMAANYVNSLKPNGLAMVFGMYNLTFLDPILNANSAAKYKPSELNYIIGGMHEPFTIHVSTKKPYETVEDILKAKNLKFGSVSPYGGDTASIMPFLDFLNIDAKLITGYKGGSATLLAAGKGEVDLVVEPASTGLRGVNKGFVKPAVVVMDYQRCSIYPNAPAITELVDFTPEQKEFFESSYLAGYILRTGAVASGVPADRVKYLREMFFKIAQLEDFKEKAFSKFPLGPTPVEGGELQTMIEKASTLNFESVQKSIKKRLTIK